MRVGEECSDGFGHSSRTHELDEVDGGALVRVEILPSPLTQLGLDALIDDEMDNSLGDAIVGRCDALVEANDTLALVH